MKKKKADRVMELNMPGQAVPVQVSLEREHLSKDAGGEDTACWIWCHLCTFLQVYSSLTGMQFTFGASVPIITDLVV